MEVERKVASMSLFIITCFYSTYASVEDAAYASYWCYQMDVDPRDCETRIESSENKKNNFFYFTYEWNPFKLRLCVSFCVVNAGGKMNCANSREYEP